MIRVFQVILQREATNQDPKPLFLETLNPYIDRSFSAKEPYNLWERAHEVYLISQQSHFVEI